MPINYILYYNIMCFAYALVPFALPLLISGGDKRTLRSFFITISITIFYSYINIFPKLRYDYEINASLFIYVLYVLLFFVLEKIITKVFFSIPFKNFRYTAGKPREFLFLIGFSLSEEFIFRGVLFYLVLGLSESVVLTVIISSVAYGISSYYTSGIVHMCTKPLLGVVLSIVLLMSGNLGYAIMCHWAYNAFVILYDVLFGKKEEGVIKA